LKPLSNTRSDVSISVAGIQTPIPAAPPKSSGSRFWVSGAVALAILGVIALRGKPHPEPSHAAVAPPIVAIPSTGTVHIDSSPEGALVEWRGAPIGRTPIDATLALGTQTLRISQDGYEAQEVSLVVQANAPTAKAVALRGSTPIRASTPATPVDTPASFHGATRSSFHRATKPTSAPPATPPTAAPPVQAAPAPEPLAAPARSKIRVVDDTDAP